MCISLWSIRHGDGETSSSSYPPVISFSKFIQMMNTESKTELDYAIPSDVEESWNELDYAIPSEVEESWNDMIEFEWNRADKRSSENKSYPFYICYSNRTDAIHERRTQLLEEGVIISDIKSTHITGFERREYLIEQGFNSETLMTLVNEEFESCFLTYEDVDFIKSTKVDIKAVPVSFSMKILGGSYNEIDKLINSQDKSKPVYFDIMFCPGALANITVENARDKVLEYVSNGSILEEDFFWAQQPESKKSYQGKYWSEILSMKNKLEDVMNMIGADEYTCSSEIYDNFTFTIQEGEMLERDVYVLTMKSNTVNDEENSVRQLFEKKCFYELLLFISLMPETCSIQIRPEITISNNNAKWLVQTGVKEVMPWYDIGLNGAGEVIAISDTGIDMDHCYIDENMDNYRFGRPRTLDLSRRKVVQYDDYIDREDVYEGHGSHVAGSIAGSLPSEKGISEGIAFDAKIAFIDIGSADGRLETPDVRRLLDTGSPYAKIHTMSWGSEFIGYGIMSWLIDSYLHKNDELLVNVAAGNEGNGDVSYTVGDPATAKNVIAVGAHNSYGSDQAGGQLGPSYVAGFSSRGPTLDGRTKPDILAPGKWISSIKSGSKVGQCDPSDGKPPGPNKAKAGLVSMMGTSMSAPIVSGVAALIRQYLREGFYPTGERNATNAYTNPSSALIKAIILNGAQYMAGVDNGKKGVSSVNPYDNTQNFGRVSLAHSLYIKNMSEVQSVLLDRKFIINGQTRYYTVKIDTSGGCINDVFSVTLVWNDVPGVPGCLKCFVNDLDLYVTKTGNDTIKIFPNGRDTKDFKNNAERVQVQGVQDGDVLTAYVVGFNIQTKTQHFSLVFSGCFAGTNNQIDLAKGVFTTDNSKQERKNRVIIGVTIPLVIILLCCASGMYFKKRSKTEELE